MKYMFSMYRDLLGDRGREEVALRVRVLAHVVAREQHELAGVVVEQEAEEDPVRGCRRPSGARSPRCSPESR